MNSSAYVSVVEPSAENNWADATLVVALSDLAGQRGTLEIDASTARILIRELEVGLAAAQRLNRKTRVSTR